MRNYLTFLFCFAAALITGCNHGPIQHQAEANPYEAKKTYSEAELNKIIAPGMTVSDVTNAFGQPGSAVKFNENTILLTYMFPFSVSQGEELTGFSVDIENGRVARWSPVTGGMAHTLSDGGGQESFGEQLFRAYLAVGSLTNLAHTIDLQGSCDAAELKKPSEMEFKAKVFAGSSGGDQPGEQTVILVVDDQDAAKLKDLTENNFGRRLLIVCRNKVIAAPVISTPIGSNEFLFTVKNSSILDNFKDK